jgi:hypothetical protein
MDLQAAVQRFGALEKSTVPRDAFPRMRFSRDGLKSLILAVLCAGLSQREASQARLDTATNRAGSFRSRKSSAQTRTARLVAQARPPGLDGGDFRLRKPSDLLVAVAWPRLLLL